MDPAHAATLGPVLQIDDRAATIGGTAGERQELDDAPGAAVAHDVQMVVLAELLLIHAAELAVTMAFTRAELEYPGHRQARILPCLLFGQA